MAYSLTTLDRQRLSLVRVHIRLDDMRVNATFIVLICRIWKNQRVGIIETFVLFPIDARQNISSGCVLCSHWLSLLCPMLRLAGFRVTLFVAFLNCPNPNKFAVFDPITGFYDLRRFIKMLDQPLKEKIFILIQYNSINDCETVVVL